MDSRDTFKISRSLRNEIFEILEGLQFSWSGKGSKTTFLGALYDLESLPSYDSRFANAFQDIHQHTELNCDWEESWVLSDPRFELLTGPDLTFLVFVAKSLSARRDWQGKEQSHIQNDLNELLRESGFSLEVKTQLSTGLKFQPISFVPLGGVNVESLSEMFTSASKEILEIAYIRTMITRASKAVDSDPELAIGTAKEILEATYKQLLTRLSVSFGALDQPQELAPKLYPKLNFVNMGSSDYFQNHLNDLLKSVVRSVTNIRNVKGSGHGRAVDSKASNHLAKMILLTVCVHCEFLVRQYELKNLEDINRTDWAR